VLQLQLQLQAALLHKHRTFCQEQANCHLVLCDVQLQQLNTFINPLWDH
jgi:hypothetical protein